MPAYYSKKYIGPWSEREPIERAKFTRCLLGTEPRGKLLDIGSLGLLKEFLPKEMKYFAIGIDKEENVTAVDLNEGKLPFNEKFDYIICTGILEHLFFPRKILEEIKRVSKSSTLIVFSLPNDKGLVALANHFFFKIQPFEIQIYGHHWLFDIPTAKKFLKDFHIISVIPYMGAQSRKLVPGFLVKAFPGFFAPDIFYIARLKR